MPKRPRFGFAALLFGIAAITVPAQTPTPKPEVSSAAARKYLNLPLAFERQGTGTSERYVARGQGYMIGIQGGKATIGIISGSNQASEPGSRKPGEGTTVKAVSLEFAGGRTAKASPRAELPGKVNYIRGNDPRKWQLGLSTYGQVAYPGVYPGIDVVYYGNQQQLEFDFVVKPGADPGAIRMKVRGASELSIDASGALNIGEAGSGLRVDLPKIYQEVKGAKTAVKGHYALRGNNEVAFQVDHYDRKRALVIDPTIVYSTLLGGGTNYSVGYGIALDASNNIIVAGYTAEGDFPTVNAAQSGASVPADGFVTKINAAGTAIVYSTYLGGSGFDLLQGIAVDQTSGAAWVTGYTQSADFPLMSATQTVFSGSEDAVIVKLSASGALQFSTYLGGSSETFGSGIAVDNSENAYVTGYYYGDFPTTVSVLQGDAFVAKYGSTGTLLYSTTIGGGGTGGGSDTAYGIAADGLGDAYVTGVSYSSTFTGAPAGGAQIVNQGNGDAYVAELNPTATGLLYFTFLGGTANDTGEKIAIDGSGNAYIAGTTSSTGLATAGAAKTSPGGAIDGFIAKLNLTGSTFTYVTYLGGIRNDYLQGIAVNGAGEVYVTGYTDSADFPVVSPLQSALPGNGVSLYQSSNSAGSFSAFDANIPGAILDIAPDPVNPGTIIAATEAGIYRTTNSGASWTQQSNAMFFNYQGSILARSPATPTTIYAVQYSQVYQSTDNGVTWTYMGSAAVGGGGILADPLTANTLYLFANSTSATTAAVYKSTDGGATWNPAATGLPAGANSTAVQSEVATTDGALYLAFYQSGIYKSTNQGGSWAAVNSGLPTGISLYRHGLAASGTTAYFAYGQIYVTTNGGTSWVPVPTNVSAYQLAVSPQNASVIYAITSSNTVEESSDGGVTWSAPATGLSATASEYYSVTGFAVNPTDATDVFLVAPVPTAAFVAKLNSAGSGLAWSTYLASGGSNNNGNGYAQGLGIATNGTGVFVTGYTFTQGFPVTSTSFGPQFGAEGAFVTEISDATATCAITLSPSTTFASEYGGDVSVNVLAPSGCAWTASTDQTWAPVSAGGSGTGVGVVTISPSSNSAAATRTATLTVGNQTATITQPSNSCSYSVDQSVYSASASGGVIPVVLTASAGCPWSVINNYPSAISVGNSSGTGSGTITLTVARNTGLDPLNFDLQVGYTDISLIQAGTCLSLSASGASTPLGGGTGSVNVIATNPACTWTASSSASWVTITSTANANSFQQNGTGNGTVTWSSQADANAARTGILPIAGLPYTITQGTVTGATTTSLGVSGNNPSIFGQSVTLTATVAPAAAPGSVTFYNGAAVLGSGVLSNGIARLTTTLLPAGTGHLKAAYVASGNFLASASTVVAQTVNANPSGMLSATPASPIGAGTGPAVVAVGDFNADGVQDFAIANSGSNNVTVLLGDGSGGFTAATGSPFTVGTGPVSVAVGDFNADGIQDLAVGNNNTNNVTVLLGNGSGGFSPARGSPFAAGAGPVSVAVGDFNGDGIADLAVGDFTGNSVTILLGNGSGGFSAAEGSPFAAGSTPNSVAVGDFNGDGFADLAVANSGSSSNKLTVLLGNGSGGFSAATGSPFAVGTNPYSVVVGDFNGDGNLDLATANAGSNNVTVLLGNGSGGFSAAPNSPFAVGTDPNFVGIGDFNGDGIPDLVTANFNSNNVSVLLGNGSAGFAPALGTPLGGTGAHSLAVGDFNGDGRTDLVAANFSSNNVTVLLGSSTATGSVLSTTSPATIAVGTAVPLTLTVSDSATAFNAPTGAATFLDGATVLGAATQATSPYSFSATGLAAGTHTLTATYSGDTRSASSTSNTITITVNASVSTPTISSLSPSSAAAGGPAFTLTVNGTNFVSGATVEWGTTALTTTFVSGTQVTAAVTAAQITTAALVSVTVVNPGPITSPAANFAVNIGGSTTTLLSSPSPSVFGQSVTLTATVAPAAATGKVTFYEGSTVLGIGTVSGGVAQLTTALLPSGTGTLKAYYGGDPSHVPSTSGPTAQTVNANPSGTLTEASGSPFLSGVIPCAVATADFNRDGIQDLAVANNEGGNVAIFLGGGTGGFNQSSGSPFTTGTGPCSVAVADFNRDGFQDVAIGNQNTNNITVLLGDGSGNFTAASGSPFAAGSNPFVTVGDFNGDGIPDLATANFSGNNVTVLLGDGAGGFSAAPGSPFAAGANPLAIVVGDFNGDGKADIATANFGGNNVTILLGNGAGGFSAGPGSPLAAGTSPRAIAMGDFNGDHVSDLAIANESSNKVTVLLGSGAGGFSAASGSPFGAGTNPFSVAVGDFNGDGIQDLALASDNSDSVTVLLGDGAGNFNAVVGGPFATDSSPVSIAIGDFNGDGRTDLVATNTSGNSVTVLLGGSAATGSVLSTTSPATITVGTAVPLRLAVSDTGTAFNAQTGTAQFYDGETLLGTATQATGPYTFSATGLAVGSHSLTANYNGDARTLASSSNTVTITVNPAVSTPTISSLSPASAISGGPAFTLTVNGTNFVSGATVEWGATALTTTFVSATQLTAAVAAAQIATAGTVNVTVANPGPVTSAAATFTVLGPTISSLSPSVVTAGGPTFTLTVNGQNFAPGAAIKWNATNPVTTDVSATQLTASISASLIASAGSASITVINSSGATSAPATLTIAPTPAVTSVTPSSVSANSAATAVTIAGSNFVTGDTVSFTPPGGTATLITPSQIQAAQIAATIPAALLTTAGSAKIAIQNGAATLSSQLPFTIVPAGATPTILGLSPYSATMGGPAFTVTVVGTNFVANSTVQWGGTALTTTLVSATQLTASVSAAQIAATGPVSVTVANTSPVVTSASFTFNVLAPTGQTWTQLMPAGGPPAARGGASAVFVPLSTMVLFGGNGGPSVGLLNDTWTLDTTANQWSPVTPGGTPPSFRVGMTAVADTANQIMTIFGGLNGSGCLNDVWTLSNSTGSWAQLSPTGTAPTPRNKFNAVYDPGSNRMVVFGGDDACGVSATTFYNDVWVLTNANGLGGTPAWTQLTPTGTLPAGRAGASAVYDPASNEMIVFGGSTVAAVNDVWVLTNANGIGGTPAWIQETPAGTGIPPRAYHTAVYDPVFNRMTVFGGQRSVALNDTWVLTNANNLGTTPTWTQLAPSGAIPPVRTVQTAVLDPTTNRMIVFGGNASTTGSMFLNDTWVLSDANGLTPSISVLTPNSVVAGSGAITLAVNGQGFASGAVVNWNGVPLATTVLTSSQLTAAVGSNLTANAGAVSVTIVNPDGSTSAPVTFTITPAPVSPLSITSGAPPNGVVNAAYAGFTFTGTGGSGTNAWAAGGVAGLSIDPASGILSGTPTTAGTFTLTVTLSNAGTSVSQNYSVTIAAAPLVITTSALPGGTESQAYSAQLAGSGGSGSYQWAISGIAGLTVNATSGAIGGSSAVGGNLTLNVTLSDASNASATPATKAFTVTITFTPVSIKSSGALGGFAPGAAVAATFAAAGGSPAYTWSATGLPASLSLNATTGQLSGTAPANPGNYSFAVTVSDAEKPAASASATVTLSVLGITTSTTLPSGTTATSYSLNFTAAGGTPPYVFSAASVPAGLTLTSTGFLSGTPASTGTTSFTVQVTDASGVAVAGTFSLTVASGVQPIQVTGAALPDGSATASYSQTLEAQDGQPSYKWVVLGGTLPAGLTLSSAGTISGTPTMPGLATFTARATDSAGGFAAGVFTINVDAAVLQVTAAALPNGMAGLPYGAQPINATGGFAPYTYALTQGSLPAPLTFTNGQINNGVPASAGTSTFTVTVTDAQGNTASQAFTLVIEVTHPDLILSQGAVGFAIATNAVTLPAAASVTVGSSVANSLGFNFNVNPAAAWLDVTGNGSTPGSVTIALDPVNAAQLGKGIYQTSVVVSCLPLSGCSGSHNIAVTLTVTAPAPQLTLGSSLLSFSATGNSSQTLAQPLNVQNSGGGVVTIQSVTAADAWVKFDPATIPPPSVALSAGQALQVNVFADTTALSGPGYYQSTITVTSDAGTVTVPVTLLIAANATMTLSPAGSQFNTVAGNTPGIVNGSFVVSVSGSSTVNWTAAVLATSPAATWLTLNTASGSSTSAQPGTIGFTINGAAASLTAQPYYATIEVTATGSSVTNPVQDYQVVLNVTAAGNIAAPNPDPQGLIFISTAAGTLPAQVVTVGSSSAGVSYSATSDSPAWLTVSPGSGTTSAGAAAQSSVSVNTASLGNGVYHGGVNYAIAGQVRSVNVTLIVALPVKGAAVSGVSGKASTPGCTATRIIPTQTGLVNNFSLPTAWPTPLEITVTDDCGNAVTSGQVVATFSNDDPALVLPVVGGSAGVYSGTWTPRATASQVTITAQATATGFKAASVLITGEVTRNAAPVLNAGGTLNAFVPVLGGPLAPGMIVQIYGANLASQAAVSSAIPLTTSLNNTTVIIGGVAAPLYFVSPGQINAQVPFELTAGSQYQVVVNANGQYSTPNPIQLAGDAPGIAAYVSGGVIAEHADGTLVTEAAPAAPNEYIVFFVSGMGATNNPVASGAPSPGSPGLAQPTDPPVLTLNGVNVPVAFAGLTPTLVGLYQVNFQVPGNAPNGDLQLVLTQTGGQSNSTVLPVHE